MLRTARWMVALTLLGASLASAQPFGIGPPTEGGNPHLPSSSAALAPQRSNLALGLTSGLEIQEPLTGLSMGVGVSLVYFPDSRELALYLITPDGGAQAPRVDHIWRMVQGELRHNGLQFDVDAGVEAAYYDGPEHRTLSPAESFEGVFHTLEASVHAVVDVSGYVGDPDSDGGQWYGGTITASLGIPGAGYMGWRYTRIEDPLGQIRQAASQALHLAAEAVRVRVSQFVEARPRLQAAIEAARSFGGECRRQLGRAWGWVRGLFGARQEHDPTHGPVSYLDPDNGQGLMLAP